MMRQRTWGALLAAGLCVALLVSVSFAPAVGGLSVIRVPLAACPPVSMSDGTGGQAASGTPIALFAPAKGKAAPAATDTGGESASKKFECFLLPTNWRNADGSVNQAAILAQEKTRLDTINKELKVTMKVKETPHYLIFSCAPDKETQLFTSWCENLYANLCRQFEITTSEHLWDGKCLLMLFETKDQYKANAKAFDRFGTNIDKTSGYFLWECREVPGMDPRTLPQLVHICIPVEKRIPQELQAVFAHEATHAFFEMYRRPGRLPLWLHEGLATYMEVVNEPMTRAYRLHLAKDYADTGKSLVPMLTGKLDDLTPEQYGVAYTLVEDLISLGGPKFKKFVINLKDGQEVDAAMKGAFGFDTVAFEKQWREGLSKVKVVKKG
jgi:hypothetical protein